MRSADKGDKVTKRFSIPVCPALLLLLVTAVAAAAPAGYPDLLSITRENGETNTTVTITSLAGRCFDTGAGFRLGRGIFFRDTVGNVKSVNCTSITGTINLDKQEPGHYEVCVFTNAGFFTCGLSFRVTEQQKAATAGSIFFETGPTVRPGC